MSITTVKPLDQTRWHNPAEVRLETVGPNHRLLTQDELDKPLPEGAEYWSPTSLNWATVVHHGIPDMNLTYRVPIIIHDRALQEFYKEFDRMTLKLLKSVEKNPLTPTPGSIPLSDRLRRERDRLDEQIRVVEAVEKGARFEVRSDYAVDPWKSWSNPDEPLAWYISQDRFAKWEVRLKPTPPTPSSIPWTLESHPDVACVKSKTDPSRHYLVTLWEREPRDGRDRAYVEGIGWIKCQVLHEHWLQRSGEPAGQEVQG